jgi:hypothetical protein
LNSVENVVETENCIENVVQAENVQLFDVLDSLNMSIGEGRVSNRLGQNVDCYIETNVDSLNKDHVSANRHVITTASSSDAETKESIVNNGNTQITKDNLHNVDQNAGETVINLPDKCTNTQNAATCYASSNVTPGPDKVSIGQNSSAPSQSRTKHNENYSFDVDKDLSIVHIPDKQEGDVMEINLNRDNMAVAKLPNNESVVVLFDSGATQSIACASSIAKSKFLASLPQHAVSPIKFKVGNGSYITSEFAIDIPLIIQGHRVLVTAMVVPNLGGLSIILGDKSLGELDSTLYFKAHTLRFKANSVIIRPTANFVVGPRQSRIIKVTGKLPHVLKNASGLLKSTRLLSEYCPTLMLVNFSDYIAEIQVTNHTNKEVTLWKDQPIATLCLKSLLNWYEPVMKITRSPSETTLYHESPSMAPTSNGTSRNKCYALKTPNSDIKFTSREDLLRKKKELYPFLEDTDPRLKMTNEEIIQRDIKFEECILDPDGQKKVRDMLIAYQDALSLHSEVGQTDLTVDFDLIDTTPFFIRPFTVSPAEKPFIDKELDKLVKMGILQEDTSQYSSPIMLIKKKDTSTRRLVTDFRFLNQRILKQNLPFPLVRDAIQIIGHSEAKVISVLDLKEAYHCLNLTPRSQKYCGITSYFGGRSFTYKKLPMGLSISPSEFQTRINKILGEIQEPNEFCIGIMDDLIVFSKSTEEHHVHLKKILSILQQYGLKISPAKAKLFRQKVTYMGHEIVIQDSRPCIQPLQDRTEAIRKLPLPDTKRRLKGFIGKVSYLAMFLPHLQTLLKPLHAISSKKAEFIWTEEHQNSYDKILELLAKPPVLTMPRGEGLFRLYADTSKIGVGASLWQLQDGKERLIAYYSKSLSKAAMNYSITELELTGLEASISAFKHLLRGVYFECFTDHAAIPQILKAKTEPSSERIKRLLERLSGYCMKVGFRKGSTMVVCDYLSRNPQPHGGSETIAFALTRGTARRDGIPVPSIQESAAVLEGKTPKATAPTTPMPDASVGQQPVRPQRETAHRPDLDYDISHDEERHEVRAQEQNPSAPSSRLVDTQWSTQNVPIEALVTEEHDNEVFETHAPVPDTFTKQSQPIFNDIGEVILKHLPKQAEINKMLNKIKSKALRNYHLPYSKREIAKQQSVCPDFKDVYSYILEGLLPSDKKAAKRVMCNAENYILIDNVLFRLIVKSEIDCKVTLAVPRTLVSDIISLYHDSLLSCHQGVIRVAMTIKQKFYFPMLHQRVYDYIRSCQTCQARKHPVYKERPFEVNIPTSYKPFETVYCDLKVMPESYQGHRYILVLVCAITRYVILHPLISKDALNVAETILQKCVFIHGPFKRFICDEGKEFQNSVINRIFNALKISQKFVSVGNHKSNRCERYVGTVANFLTSCLTGNGKNWHLFCNAVSYAFNSFSSPTLGGYSPYYLVYLRDPPEIIDCAPDTVTVASNYREYVDLLKQRLETVSKTVLDLEAKLQAKQAQDQLNKIKKVPMFTEGMLVYLLAPTHSALRTNSRKIRLDFLGPLAIFSMLDRNHAILQTLEGKQVQGVFHVARLKIAWVRTDNGAVNTMKELKQAQYKPEQHLFTDETGAPLNIPDNHLRLTMQREPIRHELFYKFAEVNSNLAVSREIQDEQMIRLINSALNHSHSQIYDITKARFKNGDLQLFLRSPRRQQGYWLNINDHPNMEEWSKEVIENRPFRITGSKTKFVMKLM